MRAARLIKPGEPLRIEELPVPEPQAGEILLQVHACGLCGTDIHLGIHGDIPVEHTPITLGHEATGVVAGVGAAVSEFKEGDRVALFPSASCGRCRFCSTGQEALCEISKVYGMARDGALAQYMTAPVRSALRLPEAVPFDVGAVVTDGVSTPFRALRSRGNLRTGENVGVFGCGGLGTHAVLLARLMGAALIVAVDVDPAALKRAKNLGADYALDPTKTNVPKTIRKLLGGAGLNLTLEFVGLQDTVDLAIRSLDKCGRAVLVGVGMGRPTLPPLISFVGREQSIMGSFGMERRDIEDLFVLIANGKLDLSDSISARYPLEKANDALQHLASKEGGVVRVVVQPNE